MMVEIPFGLYNTRYTRSGDSGRGGDAEEKIVRKYFQEI